jgi:predicted small metal-binding protein
VRVIDCECGTTIAAPNDEELAARVRAHLAAEHPDLEMTVDELETLVAARAYEASDA